MTEDIDKISFAYGIMSRKATVCTFDSNSN